jgi:hypothetical protein
VFLGGQCHQSVIDHAIAPVPEAQKVTPKSVGLVDFTADPLPRLGTQRAVPAGHHMRSSAVLT